MSVDWGGGGFAGESIHFTGGGAQRRRMFEHFKVKIAAMLLIYFRLNLSLHECLKIAKTE